MSKTLDATKYSDGSYETQDTAS